MGRDRCLRQAGWQKTIVSMEVTWAGALGRCVDAAGRCYGAQTGEWLLQVPQAGADGYMVLWANAMKCGQVSRCHQEALWCTGG